MTPSLLQCLRLAVLRAWTQNHPKVVGTCPGHHPQPMGQNCVFIFERPGPPLKAKIPKISPKTQTSITTHYHNSFGVKAARLWNLLPKTVNEKTTLDSFKARKLLESLPDTSSTDGYTALNNNSLVQWNLQRGPAF